MNPFRDRICKVFSSSKDGNLTFEDFLDMMSVFSENAPKSVKVEYAFRIYGKFKVHVYDNFILAEIFIFHGGDFKDFNEDDYICENDLKKVIQRLCGDQRLSNENMQALIEKVIVQNYIICNFYRCNLQLFTIIKKMLKKYLQIL